MSIPCDKTFLLVPSSRLSVKVKVGFQGDMQKCKTWDLTFECYDIGPSYLICEFVMIIPFCFLQVQGYQSRSVFKVILKQNANFNNGHNF